MKNTENSSATYYILRDLEGYGSSHPVCVGREEAEHLMKEWYSEDDAPAFDDVWEEASAAEIEEYGISEG